MTGPDSVEKAAPQGRRRKVLITGLGRSGTSAVASIVNQLGYFMPSSGRLATLEDLELRPLLKAGEVDKVAALLRQRADEHELVAWKDPKLFSSAGEKLLELLDDDWLYVLVFRDPLSIATRNHRSLGRNLDDALLDAGTSQFKLIRFHEMMRGRRPVYKISYERLVVAPDETLKNFIGFLGFDAAAVDLQAIKASMAADHGRYLSVQPDRSAQAPPS